MISNRNLCQMAFAIGYDAFGLQQTNPYSITIDEVLYSAWHCGYTLAAKIAKNGMH